MKKLLISILSLALFLCLLSSASALSNAEKEDLYNAAIGQLEAVLESSGELDDTLDGIFDTLDTLQNYDQSKMLKYYTGVLIKLRNGEYDAQLDFYLKGMKSNERFVAYLENREESPIYTLPELEAYVDGRKAQHDGDNKAAIACYNRCNNFYDSFDRLEDLTGEMYVNNYADAEALLMSGNLVDAYRLFVEMPGYRDSNDYVAYIYGELGYDPLHEHEWRDATCETLKICTLCGATEEEALGHMWDNGKVTTKATCISEGVTTYACTMCGTTKNDSTPKDASNHTGGTRVEGAYDVTCGSTGYTGDTYCLSCGAKIGNGSSISATGNHNWQPATYDAPKTCRVCGATEGEPLSRVQVGKYITFGHYHQNADGKDVSPIEWLVLDMNENKALVISRYGLDAYPFDGNYYGWENSVVREWLNDNFLNSAFSLSEQTGIIPTVVHTQDNSAWVNYYKDTTGEEHSRISSGGDTYDAVFLLSLEETQKYFGCYSLLEKTEILKAVPTAYAVARGAVDCSFRGVEYMQDGRGCCYWWLRSPGVKGYDSSGVSYSVSYVDGNGAISNTWGEFDYIAVRPAMWVDLDYVMP